MLRAFGITVESVDTPSKFGVRVFPPSRPEDLDSPAFISIPGDLSSAAFFLVAALLVPHSGICLEGVGVNPKRMGLFDVLRMMGADLALENERVQGDEPVSDMTVRASDLTGVTVSGDTVVRMIDEFPILAVAATQAHGETVVRDAAELRVKESDRIGTLTQELRRMGAQIKERADGFVIVGPTPLRGAHVGAHHDHRLAMSLAIAGLIARGPTTIEGWECVADSFPGFLDTLAQVSGQGSLA